MSQELVLEAIHRAYRIVEGLYGSDYKPEYHIPRTEGEVLIALEFLLLDLKEKPRICSIDIESMYVEEFGEKALDPWHDSFRVWCIGFSIDDYQAVCIPFDPDPYLIEKFGLTSIYDCPKILDLVQEIADLNCLHHSTFDALGLAKYGIRFKDLDDSMLIQYAIDDTSGDLGVDDLARHHTEEGGYKKRDYQKPKTMVELEWDMLVRYCCHDTDIERRLYFILKAKAIQEDVWNGYTRVLKVSNMVGIEMTLNGVAIDRPHLESLIKIEKAREEPLIKEFYERPEVHKTLDYILGKAQPEPNHKNIKKFQSIATLEDIKISKSWILEILLYDVCKFPCLNKTDKGARQVDADDLEKVKGKKQESTRVIEIVLEIKRIEKKLSTYLLPYIEPKIKIEGLTQEELQNRIATGQVDRYQYLKSDGFVHPRFNFHIARSTRATSSDPNLQNILNELGLKRSFISREWKCKDGVSRRGNLFFPDYSGHEVRTAAWLCQDPMMIKALALDFHIINQSIQAKLIVPKDIPNLQKEDTKRLKNDLYLGCLKLIEHSLPEDIYFYPYQEILKILEEEGLSEIALLWEEKYQKKRTAAKESTFGPLFGMEPPSFAMLNGLTLKEAEEVFAMDKQTYPLKHAYANQVKQKARQDGFVQSIFGLKRRLDYKHARDQARINELDRQCINMPIQGMASNIGLLAMGKCMKTFKELGMNDQALGFGTIHDALAFDASSEITEEVATIAKTVMEEYPIELLGENPVRFKAEVKFGPNWGELKKWQD